MHRAAPASSERISIHALREEGDVCICDLIGWKVGFLSTPSARRATLKPGRVAAIHVISIHALREEGDTIDGLSRIP